MTPWPLRPLVSQQEALVPCNLWPQAMANQPQFPKRTETVIIVERQRQERWQSG